MSLGEILEITKTQARLIYVLIGQHNLTASILIKAEELRAKGQIMTKSENIAENRRNYDPEQCVFCKKDVTRKIGAKEKVVKFKARWEESKGPGDAAISRSVEHVGSSILR